MPLDLQLSMTTHEDLESHPKRNRIKRLHPAIPAPTQGAEAHILEHGYRFHWLLMMDAFDQAQELSRTFSGIAPSKHACGAPYSSNGEHSERQQADTLQKPYFATGFPSHLSKWQQ